LSTGINLARDLVRGLLERHAPRAIVSLRGGEPRRSLIHDWDFVQTNILGTFTLLEEGAYLADKRALSNARSSDFCTSRPDEVFGSLGPHEPPFKETTPFAPNSPYAARRPPRTTCAGVPSHLRAATLTVNCSKTTTALTSFPEKLIPS